MSMCTAVGWTCATCGWARPRKIRFWSAPTGRPASGRWNLEMRAGRAHELSVNTGNEYSYWVFVWQTRRPSEFRGWWSEPAFPTSRFSAARQTARRQPASRRPSTSRQPANAKVSRVEWRGRGSRSAAGGATGSWSCRPCRRSWSGGPATRSGWCRRAPAACAPAPSRTRGRCRRRRARRLAAARVTASAPGRTARLSSVDHARFARRTARTHSQSRDIPTAKHFLNLQYWHLFRFSRYTMHFPSRKHRYSICFWMLRRKNP